MIEYRVEFYCITRYGSVLFRIAKYYDGKHQENILKEHGEKEYNRGLSEARILAKKSDNPKGSQGSGSTKNKVSLNDEQKQAAEDMYDSAIAAGTPKDEIYEWYKEYHNIKG